MIYFLTFMMPLLNAVLTIGTKRFIGDKGAQILSCVGMFLSLLFALKVFQNVVFEKGDVLYFLTDWIAFKNFKVEWAIKFDTLSATMVALVMLISFLVHCYSIGYMAKDPAIARFMAYLSLFTFFMVVLVTANNFLQLFFGWEGVGLSSYLLIGFWYTKPAANQASLKAFLMNRVADIFFLIGLFLVFKTFHSLDFTVVFSKATALKGETFLTLPTLAVICLLLFIGAMGKSAQIGLHTWLPDAMAGPTPVSALIHAATMVTAGVFLLIRIAPLLELAPFVKEIILTIGLITAIVGGTIALVQNDIKHVIAYSTCSQLGFMMAAIGCGAYPIAFFHLLTHAFFKALLFLGAGSVIHALSGEQDMQKMGGIYRLIPLTYTFMWIGTLALIGMPFFAGFYSKEAIMKALWMQGGMPYFWGLLGVLLTSLYMGRFIFLVFHGEAHADERVMAHVHESPRSMQLPLFVLAGGALFSGLGLKVFFIGEHVSEFWQGLIPLSALIKVKAPWFVEIGPLGVTALGFLTIWMLYTKTPQLLKIGTGRFVLLYQLLIHKLYFDVCYKALFIKPAFKLGKFLWQVDDEGVDRLLPKSVSHTVCKSGQVIRGLQNGSLYSYITWFIFGVIAVLGWFMVSLKGWLF